jgi:hypothetical protein
VNMVEPSVHRAVPAGALQRLPALAPPRHNFAADVFCRRALGQQSHIQSSRLLIHEERVIASST